MIRSAFAASLALFAASCSSPTASVMPYLASIGVNGDFAISDAGSGSNARTSFDQLGLDDDEASFGGLVRLGFGGMELSVSGLGLEYDGEGTTRGEFSFGDETISDDVDVETDVDIAMARVLMTWDLVPVNGVDLGIGIGATLLDLKFSLRDIDPDTPTSDMIETDQLIPIPMVGARAAWTWGPVDLRADAGGLIVSYDDADATFFEADLSGSVNVYEMIDLVVGYRITSIDAEYEDEDSEIDANFNLQGFYGGLQASF